MFATNHRRNVICVSVKFFEVIVEVICVSYYFFFKLSAHGVTPVKIVSRVPPPRAREALPSNRGSDPAVPGRVGRGKFFGVSNIHTEGNIKVDWPWLDVFSLWFLASGPLPHIESSEHLYGLHGFPWALHDCMGLQGSWLRWCHLGLALGSVWRSRSNKRRGPDVRQTKTKPYETKQNKEKQNKRKRRKPKTNTKQNKRNNKKENKNKGK